MTENADAALAPGLGAWHFLSRITFGPSPQDVARTKKAGIATVLDEQLHPKGIDDTALEERVSSLPTLAMGPKELMEDFPAPKRQASLAARREVMDGNQAVTPSRDGGAGQFVAEMRPAMEGGPRRISMELGREQFWRAAYSQRQLQEVMVHFWMNHFNVYAAKGVDRWLLTSFERDAIRPNALGSFSRLLSATAQSPAMLFYLDNWLSVAPNAAGDSGSAQGRHGLNENYARELMELHTLGVDGGYTQQDVREVARCFTGWTIDRPRQGGGFIFRPRFHDYGEKVVLGRGIHGGGVEDGMEVLRILAAHPSTAHLISLKLCRHFVSDDPPASVVERGARTFAESHGEIGSVLKTILTSPEFSSSAAFRAKVKSPFELVASAFRTLDVETDGGTPLMGLIMRMGQPLFLYQAPTGYPDRANNWINSGTLLARMNFSMALAANLIRGTQLDLQALLPSDDGQAAWEQLVQRTLGGSISRETQMAVMKSLNDVETLGGASPRTLPKTSLMAALILGSPEFQRR